MLLRLSAAVVIAASIAGCANAYTPPYGGDILSELPADAPPGECYARVRVPGEPVAPPPVMMGAQWVLNPGPPGSPGPIWCLVPTGPQPVAAPVVEPERYGWIRVLCDRDATPDRIRGVQKRLYDDGYYQGPVSGAYDAATAAAVGRFQVERHISHGGYLSLQTLDAIEATAPAPVYGYGYSAAVPPISPCAVTCPYQAPPPPPVYYAPPAPPCCQAAPVYAPPPAPCCQAAPVYAPPPVYYAPPCCAAAQPYAGGYVQGGYAQQGYYQQGYYAQQGYYTGSPAPAYAAARASASARAYAGGASASARASASVSTSTVQNGWLTWGGMTRY
jgi:peptidoglycan hydrolase-like protein with peptidoglycan-binding domain